MRSLEAYIGKTLEMVPVDIAYTTVAIVVRKLLGSAGPGGVDSVSLKYWLLWFGVASMGLIHIFGEFRDWMANSILPWESYREPMSGRLIGLNKCPG